MIITPINPATPATSPGAPSTEATSARERAIQALMGSAADVNQNSVSPEEMGAVKAPDVRQTDTDEATTDSPSKEEPISSQYAVLARKEKAIRAKAVAQEQAFKAREAALAAREAELAQKAQTDLSNYIPKDKLKQNAYNALLEAGVSYDEFTEQALRAQSPEAQQLQALREELRQELSQLREEQDKTRQTLEQNQTQAYQDAVRQIRTEAKLLVAKDPDFETVRATNSVDDVVDLIERTFQEDGVLMSVEEAAAAVEEHLVEEALKLSQLGKIQARLSKNSAQSQGKQNATQQQGNNFKTLTNSVGSTRQLTAKERAILAFKGELK